MTINDIAKEAGVSRSTVSRVINKSANVNEKKRLKVEEVIKKYNFILDKNAASTKSKKKTKTYLILLTRLDSYSENRVVRGIMDKIDEEVELIFFETQFSIEKTKRIVENNRIANAIIVFAISGADYNFLEDSLVPIVYVGQKINTKHSCLYFPDYIGLKSLLLKNKAVEDKPIFLGFDEEDKTKVNRFLATNDVYENIEFLVIKGYLKENLGALQNIDISAYNVFVCATEDIALLVYINILKLGISDYKIISVGNNRNNNYVMQNYNSVDFHYKQAGRYIVDGIQNNKVFMKEQDYSLVVLKNKVYK